ncbi:nicotinamide N-methyltransferase-like isoform X2 [Rhinoderma darwinii]|uniref:nicotinamide N-methyltransferase-like isoform X2 n=1 Tax=Rhinoderma darwinii TaxID=43563 RepID=UPI003F66E3BC
MTTPGGNRGTHHHDKGDPGRVKGQSLIEIGSGPSIHYILSACESFEKIYLTDYFQGNLTEIKKWLNSENDAFDWSPYLRFVCDLENNGSTTKGKEEKIRSSVSLMKSDITLTNPLQPHCLPLTDCVLIAGCIICGHKTITDFKNAIKNIVSLVKPGGHLIISDYLGASYYMVGEAKFPVLSIDENVLEEAVVESGCTVEDLQTFKDLNYTDKEFDCKNVFILLAQRL